MLTLHLAGPLAGDGPSIDVNGKAVLKTVKKQISSVIAVPVGDFEMVHGGEVMEDMGVPVSQTALCEGDEVVIEPSRRFVAGQRLREMGVRLSNVDDLRVKVFESPDMTDEEKAGVVELMVECDPGFVHAVDCTGWAALRYACIYGLEAAALTLLGHGADIHKTGNRGNHNTQYKTATAASTYLHETAVAGKVGTARLLITNGINVNSKDTHGVTPLQEACSHGFTEFVMLLLEHGADVYAENHVGETAFDTAEYHGHSAVVELLREH